MAAALGNVQAKLFGNSKTSKKQKIFPVASGRSRTAMQKRFADFTTVKLRRFIKLRFERIRQEFEDPILGGYSAFYKNRYVLEEPLRKKIFAYLSITTSDNSNFIIDFITNNGYEISYDDILKYAISEIDRRRSVFYPIIKQKNYTKTAEKVGEYLNSKGCKPIQTQIILVKNFYRPVKTAENALQVFLFGENSRIVTN